jgi:hypothetical protein
VQSAGRFCGWYGSISGRGDQHGIRGSTFGRWKSNRAWTSLGQRVDLWADDNGHTLPFLISEFRVAFVAAVLAVVIELAVITWIRHRYIDTPVWSAGVQVAVGARWFF